VTVRYDLLDRSTIWIEDADGTHHACPLYRVRSHTERRVKHDHAAPGLSFRALFDEERHDESPQPQPQEEPPPCT
jgi:hypothetical protein